MSRKLKIVSDQADIVSPPTIPFDPAPTRKSRAGWTAEKQRKFIAHLALTGAVGEASAVAGVASSSAYRLRDRAGADSFARAWDAALRLCPTRLSAIGLDRAIHGRVERFYKDGELVMERRVPSDYLLTWFLSRLDPLQFGSPAAQARAVATGDPREKARAELPELMADFADIPLEECECDEAAYIDDRLGEMADGKVAPGE